MNSGSSCPIAWKRQAAVIDLGMPAGLPDRRRDHAEKPRLRAAAQDRIPGKGCADAEGQNRKEHPAAPLPFTALLSIPVRAIVTPARARG